MRNSKLFRVALSFGFTHTKFDPVSAKTHQLVSSFSQSEGYPVAAPRSNILSPSPNTMRVTVPFLTVMR